MTNTNIMNSITSIEKNAISWSRKVMLSTKYRVRLTDICCRIISDDTVTIEERMWMNKLCEHNQQAKDLRSSLLCPDLLEWD